MAEATQGAVRAVTVLGALAGVLAGAVARADAQAGARAAPAARGALDAGRWEVLFDGRGADPLAAWRGYRRTDVPAGWRAVGRTLALVPTPGAPAASHADLVTRTTYADFELAFTWRIVRGGNAGVLYRVVEADTTRGQPADSGNYRHSYASGPEFQLLDDAHHANGRYPTHRAGAVFGVAEAAAGVARPAAGAARWTPWQHARVVVRGWQVRHYLNGRLVAAVDLAGAPGRARVARSEMARYTAYARAAAGRIALQDGGDPVEFRDVRVRRLTGEARGVSGR